MAPSVLVLAALLSIASQGSAMQVTWEGNGNTYEYIPVLECTVICVTWTQADQAAKSLAPLPDGRVAQLATITSREEQEFIQSAVLPPSNVGVDKSQIWIGGRQEQQNPESLLPKAGWGWTTAGVTPEKWVYDNWTSPTEPNDGGGNIDERFLTMWVHYYQLGSNGLWQDLRGTWNDEQNQPPNPVVAKIIGMLVEWCNPDVPEPGTAALAFLGVGLLALRRRLAS